MPVPSRIAAGAGVACFAAVLALAAAALGQPAGSAAPAPAPLFARADELARHVAALRGLPLRAPIAKEVVDKRELRRRLVAMTGEPKEAEQLAREEVLSKHWGLVPRDLDYHAMLLDVLSEQIAGYYDSDAKRLTLTDDPEVDSDWSEMVLSHEIQHALQDQTFSLTRFREVPPGEDDAAMARLALIEGDGMGVMLETYNSLRGLTIPWQSAASLQQAAEEVDEGTDPSLEHAPLAVREALAFPYGAGFRFVAELRRQQPWSAVDAAFRRPPLSTEQILHPALYLRNELPLAVPRLALSAALRAQLGLPAVPATPAKAGRPRRISRVARAARAAAPANPAAPAAPPGPPPPASPPAGTPQDAIAKAMSALRTQGAVETVWGELGFRIFLRSHGVDSKVAAIAAAGWGGDRVTVLALERAGEELGVARLRWDSEADAREAFEAVVRAMDRWVAGPHLDRGDERATWMDLDGRVSLVERRDTSLVIAHRVPLSTSQALIDELWRSLPPPAAASPMPPPPLAPPPAKSRRR